MALIVIVHVVVHVVALEDPVQFVYFSCVLDADISSSSFSSSISFLLLILKFFGILVEFHDLGAE